MKRSEAPSHSNLAGLLKKNRDSQVKAEPRKSSKVVKFVPSTPLTAKQLKVFHYLLAAAAYTSVIEGNTENMAGIRESCFRNYHGYDEDHIGVVGNFLQENGRFGVLWDDEKVIRSGFGVISGLSYESISDLILRPTLKGRNLITGRQILDKARACLLEAKKYLAFWNEFLVDGQFPSGKNEEDAKDYVLKRALDETSPELVDDEELDCDSDKDEGNLSGDDELEGIFDDEDEKKEIKPSINRTKFVASAMIFFMLYGPYGVIAYNFDITSCLSTDSKGIDEQAKRYKNMNTTSMIETKKKEKNLERESEPDRGISNLSMQKIDLAKEELVLLKKDFERKSLMESFNVTVAMVNRSGNTEKQQQYWNEKMEEYAKFLTPTLLSVTDLSSLVDVTLRNTPSSAMSQRNKNTTMTQSQRKLLSTSTEVQDTSDSGSDSFSDVDVHVHISNDKKKWKQKMSNTHAIDDLAKVEKQRESEQTENDTNDRKYWKQEMSNTHAEDDRRVEEWQRELAEVRQRELEDLYRVDVSSSNFSGLSSSSSSSKKQRELEKRIRDNYNSKEKKVETRSNSKK